MTRQTSDWLKPQPGVDSVYQFVECRFYQFVAFVQPVGRWWGRPGWASGIIGRTSEAWASQWRPVPSWAGDSNWRKTGGLDQNLWKWRTRPAKPNDSKPSELARASRVSIPRRKLFLMLIEGQLMTQWLRIIQWWPIDQWLVTNWDSIQKPNQWWKWMIFDTDDGIDGVSDQTRRRASDQENSEPMTVMTDQWWKSRQLIQLTQLSGNCGDASDCTLFWFVDSCGGGVIVVTGVVCWLLFNCGRPMTPLFQWYWNPICWCWVFVEVQCYVPDSVIQYIGGGGIYY